MLVSMDKNMTKGYFDFVLMEGVFILSRNGLSLLSFPVGYSRLSYKLIA